MSHAATLRSDLWQARAALTGVIGLQWLVEGELHVAGQRLWIITAFEVVLLLCLTLTSERHRRRAKATRGTALRFIEGEGGIVRVLALTMIGTVSIINLWGLLLLILSLVDHTGAQAPVLLADAAFLFVTNVIVSGLWYWELDRGGPFARASVESGTADFLFPQMTLKDDAARCVPEHWMPHFGDYLYIAFTNATAFSPTDTLPLSRPAKLLMALQAGVSLLTIALVAARAVNILAQ